MKKPLSPGEALNKAAAYCTLCERCISEVSAKLTAWGVTPCEQQKIIERLQSEGFIDEARYCRAFVNDKVRFNRWGRIKIRAALSEKPLPRELVNEAIDNIDDEQYILLYIDGEAAYYNIENAKIYDVDGKTGRALGDGAYDLVRHLGSAPGGAEILCYQK